MNTLHKSERLCSKKTIETLFAGNASSFSLFPIRVVYKEIENTQSFVQIMTSVSKKHFKRAVKRNFVKRQIRESYRLQKQKITEYLASKNIHIAIAFIYLSDKLTDYAVINQRMYIALQRIEDNLYQQKKS